MWRTKSGGERSRRLRRFRVVYMCPWPRHQLARRAAGVVWRDLRLAAGASLSGISKMSSRPSGRSREAPGARVRAIWAGDGRRYDAIVAEIKNGLVEVNWLRPAPLSGEELVCVCEAGGDDTSHRQVQHQHVALAPEVQQFLDPIGSSFFVDRPVPAEGNMPVSARGSPISTIRRIPTKLKSSTSL
eukprot:TRINITY_DN9398_c0_g1_i4.p1 TRINITY_DN9398_c0_g1~~TRINITY_DN9398_c0_g1_i4.p1  ORF type:complete len:186 (+),score=16.38 TRINITY_DN9398_c0_g1_i4:181-738(+)